MRSEDQDSILSRLESVEQVTQQLRSRLDALEQAFRLPAQAPVPTWTPQAPPPVRRPVSEWRVPTVTAEPVAKPPKNVDDLEYKIGLTGLLRGGAVVIVIAIIYLVGLAVSRGYITPPVQFASELALCAVFIAIGFVKRNEREDFGQLMTGIGSCGLYLSFAGGNLAKHLYDGETLVALFIALSFANLCFAWWRSSRSFLAIGMIGGLTGAMMPMHDYKPLLDVMLHGLILVPTAMIVAKNRWKEMAIALWVASTAALIPVLTYDSVWMLRIGGLYAASLLCAATYAYVWSESKFDPNCAFSAVMVVVAGIAALAFDLVQHGSLHVLAMAGGSLAIGSLFTEKKAGRSSLWLGGLIVAATLAPVGYNRFEAGIAYAVLSTLLSLAAMRFVPRVLTVVASLELALGLCAYIAPWVNSPHHFAGAAETSMLLAFMIATGSCAVAAAKTGYGSERMLLIAAIVLLPLFTRLSFILLTAPYLAFMPALAILIPFLVFATGLSLIGNIKGWRLTVVFGCWILLLAIGQYWQLVGDGFRNPIGDSLLVLCIVAASAFCGMSLQESAGKGKFDLLMTTVGGIVSIYIIRLCVIWLTLPAVGLHLKTAVTLGMLIVAIANGATSILLKWRGLSPVAWAATLGTIVADLGFNSLGGHGLVFQLAGLALCIAALLLSAKSVPHDSDHLGRLPGLTVALVWVVFSQFAYVLLTSKGIAMKDAPALSLAWIVYALTLIVLGFANQARYLRFWSFGVFGGALVKIFGWDLSSLDPGIRVFILLLLGIGMVGAGYWYVRQQPELSARGKNGGN